jgi:hypothetical protein
VIGGFRAGEGAGIDVLDGAQLQAAGREFQLSAIGYQRPRHDRQDKGLLFQFSEAGS